MPNPRRAVSESTAQAIDQEVKGIVEASHQKALKILNHNRELLETISQKLLEVEVIEGGMLEELLKQVQDPTPLSHGLPQEHVVMI